MSILIKGVEMPTDHPMWIIVHSDGTVETNEVSQSRPVGWQTLLNAAIPVPPHGRLGDMEAIAWKIRRFGDYVEFTKDEIAGWFENGDFETIIPAEEATQMDGGQDEAPAGPYDILYEEGGVNTQ